MKNDTATNITGNKTWILSRCLTVCSGIGGIGILYVVALNKNTIIKRGVVNV